MYYQKLVVNTQPDYFYNNTHYKGVWDEQSYFLEFNMIRCNFVKVQKATIKRNMKNLIFQNKDEYTIHTIEKFDLWFEIPNIGNTEEFSAFTLLIQSDVYESNYDIKYVSIDDIISNYGGTSGVFFSIFEVIVGFFVNPFYSSSLLNEVFNFHENTMNEFELKEFMDSFRNLYSIGDNSNNNVNRKSTKLSKYNTINI